LKADFFAPFIDVLCFDFGKFPFQPTPYIAVNPLRTFLSWQC